MEYANKIKTFDYSKSKIVQAAMLIVAAFVICRGPMLGGSFAAGISFIAYMLSKNTINLYLILPSAAGIILHMSRGYEPWGYLSAMVICGIVFVAARRIKLKFWQRSVITSAAGIIGISIYSIISGTVYKTGVAELLTEGMLIFALMYIFDNFYFAAVERPSFDSSQGIQRELTTSRELSLISFTTISLMFLNGLGLSFMIWMGIIFVSLWVLTTLDTGLALIVTAAGGAAAYLMGEGQWGIMATVILGIIAAGCVKGHGSLVRTVVFAAVCLLVGRVESGVVLGIDKYCLILPTLLFIVLDWKFSCSMRRIMYGFAGKEDICESLDKNTDIILKEKAIQMKDLAELYSTYLDSRSMLANQFDITRQIIEDGRWQISRPGRKAARKENEKLDVNIAISQCAAAGVINGDCCGWQDIGGGRIAMVVSDGMGKGKKAAAESLMVTKTVMSLLRSGVTTDLALKMINTIMLMKDDEDSYATLDMVIVDKRSGKAKFYKIGAAPTLIRRKSNVEEVKLSAVPLGIVNGLKVRYVETTLKKDDWIIMMSDGVSDGGESHSEGGNGRNRRFLHQIKETAASVRSADPQTMCDLIMNKAADSYIGRERDDLTVMVARIL